MKKFTLSILTLFLFAAINFSFAANRLEITSILKPVTGSSLGIGVPVEFEFELTNNHTIDFTTQDTAVFLVAFWNGTTWANIQPVGGYVPSATLTPGNKVTVKFNLTFNFSQAGQYGVGFGAYWTKNPAPATNITIQGANYNFSGLAEEFAALKSIYYFDGKLYLTMNNEGTTSAEMFISNVNGQVVKYQHIKLSGSGISTNIIETGILPKGIYVLGLKGDGILNSKKFMVR